MKTRTCFAVTVMILVLSMGSIVSFAQTDLTFYKNNPVITPGSWDKGGPVWFPSVVLKDGEYHMFYTGLYIPAAIGYAVSSNGLSFSKHASAPVFEADGTGFDAYSVMAPSVLAEGDSLILYYAGARSPIEALCIMPRAIGRATAHSPTGPWTRSEEPVLATGGPDEWDCAFVYPNSVVATDTGYVMFYTGGTSRTASMIGVATSSDGIRWNKHGDPVLRPGDAESWDAGSVSMAAVVKTKEGWGMYYTGTGDDSRERIGYARSDDGLVWVKYEDNPILGANESWATEKVFAGAALLNSDASAYLLYYAGTEPGNLQIGVATEPLNRGDCNEDGIVNILDLVWLDVAVRTGLPLSPWHCDCNGDGREGLRDLDIICIYYRFIMGTECPIGAGKTLTTSEAMELEQVLSAYLPADDVADVMTMVKAEGHVPVAHSLMQNNPNPFNPVTSIGYTLAEASAVKLEVYNLLGQLVAVLVDGHQNSGAHQVEWDASHMASGSYFCRLTAGEFTTTRTMVLMK